MVKIFVLGCKQANIAQTTWSEQLLAQIPHVRVDSLEKCDVVFTTDLTTNKSNENTKLINKYIRIAKEKALLVFLHDDPDEAMPLKHHEKLIVFRTSLRSSTQHPYERVLPSFQPSDQQIPFFWAAGCSDPCKPKIGFCGLVQSQERKDALAALERYKGQIDQRIVTRTDFHGKWDEQTRDKNRQKFMNILQDCPYQLCCRGAGNFSHRFYEVLCAGRIPVLITNDMVLPEHVPKSLYDRCLVTADSGDKLPEALLNYHQQHDLAVSQALCRGIWESYFSVTAFGKEVGRVIHTL